MATEIEPVERREVPPDPPVPATTTTQEDITTASQRRVNLIWEVTQAIIAISVTLANVSVGTYMAINKITDVNYPLVLSSSFFLVVGFYFSRTNHTRIGGVGPKATDAQEYKGR